MTKWTEERTEQLHTLAGDMGTEVSRDTVAEIAEEMGVSNRSVSSKLRKEGFTVETASAAPKSFSDEETEELRNIVESNSGELTYVEIAERLGTDHEARSVQGKILSMELTAHVRKTPPKEVERTYTDEEAELVRSMTVANFFLEDIAEAVGKPLNSVRGKALSLLKAGEIEALPTQRDRKPAKVDIFEQLGAEKVSSMTVEELCEASGKTPRGVKTILTRRKMSAADYNGVARSEKASANS